MVVDIPKEIRSIKTKPLFGLTSRQLLSFAIAAAVAFPVYFLTKDVVGGDIATFLLIFTGFPVLVIGFYEKNGLTLDKQFFYMIGFLKRPKKRPFRSKREDEEIARAIEMYVKAGGKIPNYGKSKVKRSRFKG